MKNSEQIDSYYYDSCRAVYRVEEVIELILSPNISEDCDCVNKGRKFSLLSADLRWVRKSERLTRGVTTQ